MKITSMIILFVLMLGTALAQSEKDSSYRISIHIEKDENGKVTRIDTSFAKEKASGFSFSFEQDKLQEMLKENLKPLTEMDIRIMMDSIAGPVKKQVEEMIRRESSFEFDFDFKHPEELALALPRRRPHSLEREIRIIDEHSNCCRHHGHKKSPAPAYGSSRRKFDEEREIHIKHGKGKGTKVIIIED